MKWVMNAYLGGREWVKEYTNDVVFYDKKDLNVGYNLWDYTDWIVNNYENIPEKVLFGKTNMLERHITKKEFEEALKKDGLVPLMTANHEVDGVNAFYRDGLYWEVNNSWYFNHYESRHKAYFEVAEKLGLPNPTYLPFAPGACWMVPRENILKRSKDFYQTCKDMVGYTQLPAEAHALERSLYNIWS